MVNRSDPRLTKLVSAAALVTIVGVYAAVVFANISYAAGGSDSSGYLNTARLFSQGRATLPIHAIEQLEVPPHHQGVFRPLAFEAGPDGRYALPFYPPGLPLHMMVAAKIGGWSVAPFLVSPIAALIGLLLIYALGRELGLPRPYAIAGSAILALMPTYSFIGIQPLSGTVATAWCMAAVLFALRSERAPAWALASGAAFAVAVLVRPANMPLLPAVALALRPSLSTWVLFGAAGSPFAAGLMAYNNALFSGPLKTGYGRVIPELMKVEHFRDRFPHYVYWMSALLTPLVPLGWLACVVDRTIAVRKRLMLWAWFLAYLLFHSFYLPYEAWWNTRFLLPATPALVLGALLGCRAGVEAVGERARPAAIAIAVVLVFVVCANGYRMTAQLEVFELDDPEEIYLLAARWADEQLPARAIVVSMVMSGTMMYYTERPIARWDFLNARSFAELRERAESRGYRWYALLWPFEEQSNWQANAPGEWELVDELRQVSLWKLEPLYAPGGRRLRPEETAR